MCVFDGRHKPTDVLALALTLAFPCHLTWPAYYWFCHSHVSPPHFSSRLLSPSLFTTVRSFLRAGWTILFLTQNCCWSPGLLNQARICFLSESRPPLFPPVFSLTWVSPCHRLCALKGRDSPPSPCSLSSGDTLPLDPCEGSMQTHQVSA